MSYDPTSPDGLPHPEEKGCVYRVGYFGCAILLGGMFLWIVGCFIMYVLSVLGF